MAADQKSTAPEAGGPVESDGAVKHEQRLTIELQATKDKSACR